LVFLSSRSSRENSAVGFTRRREGNAKDAKKEKSRLSLE